jgi:hypothetical protein
MNGELVNKHFTDAIEGIYLVGFTGRTTNSPASPFRMDDVYVDVSDSGDDADEPPPSPRFTALWLTSNGSINQWTPLGTEDRAISLSMRPKEKDTPPVLQASDDDLEETYRIESVEGFDLQNVISLTAKARVMRGQEERSITMFVRDDADNELSTSPSEVEFGYRVYTIYCPLRPDGESWNHSMEDIEIGVRT